MPMEYRQYCFKLPRPQSSIVPYSSQSQHNAAIGRTCSELLSTGSSCLPSSKKHAELQSVDPSVFIFAIRWVHVVAVLFQSKPHTGRESRDRDHVAKVCLLTKLYTQEFLLCYKSYTSAKKLCANLAFISPCIKIMDGWLFNFPSCFLKFLLSAWSRSSDLSASKLQGWTVRKSNGPLYLSCCIDSCPGLRRLVAIAFTVVEHERDGTRHT